MTLSSWQTITASEKTPISLSCLNLFLSYSLKHHKLEIKFPTFKKCMYRKVYQTRWILQIHTVNVYACINVYVCVCMHYVTTTQNMFIAWEGSFMPLPSQHLCPHRSLLLWLLSPLIRPACLWTSHKGNHIVYDLWCDFFIYYYICEIHQCCYCYIIFYCVKLSKLIYSCQFLAIFNNAPVTTGICVFR